MSSNIKYLRSFLSKLTHISEESWESLAPHLKEEKIFKGHFLFRKGSSFNQVAFITQGLLKKYYTLKDDKEFIKGFSDKNNFVAPYLSLLTTEPIKFSVEALEDTELILIDYNIFKDLMNNDECWQKVGRLLAEITFINREKREEQLLTMSASERYQVFLKTYPTLHSRVSQYNIASYIGITAAALSRLSKNSL